MSGSASQIGVSTTPIELSAASETDMAGGQSVGILDCDVDLYLGFSSSITSSSTTAKLPAHTPLGLDLDPGSHLWAVTASGSGTAHVLRTGV